LQQTVFYGKTWMSVAGGIGFSLLVLLFGMMLLFNFIENGLNAVFARIFRDTGAFAAAFLFSLAAAAMNWYFAWHRQTPLLRICNEGVEVNLVGKSIVDQIPLLPTTICILWKILSLRGFKTETAWIPWEMLDQVSVNGPMMCKQLVVDGTVIFPRINENEITARTRNKLTFEEHEFVDKLELIMKNVNWFKTSPSSRKLLASLHDPMN